MLALRWLWIAAIVATAYVTYLLVAEIDNELPQVPGRLNGVVLLLLLGAAIVIGINELNSRQHLVLRARLDQIEGLVAALDRRLTAFDRRLDELECRIISFGRRLEVVEQHDREAPTRELPKIRGVATAHYAPRVVAQISGAPAPIDPDVIEISSRLKRRLKDDDG